MRTPSQAMRAHYDAIIIGAGPAGSTAAILLAQAGWSVALIEKQLFPRGKVCGECIAASNLPLLEALGVGEAFERLAGPELHRVALLFKDHSIVAALPAAADARRAWGRALGREHLDALLLSRAERLGVHVLQPCTALRLHGRAGGFVCDVAGDRPAFALRAPVAIAAHGSWEPLPADRRHLRGLRGRGELLAFKANFSGVRLESGVLPVLSFRGGYGGMVVADHGLATVACCIQAERLQACRQQWPASSAGAVIEAYLQRECRGVREALSGASRVGPWLAVGPLRPGIHLSDRSTGAFRVGNAAGEAHPIIGEGISMAMQSAWLLCALLLDGRGVPAVGAGAQRRQHELQQRYAKEWRAQFATRLQLAACFAQIAMRPRAMTCLLPMLRHVPALLTLSARWSGKIRCAPAPALIAALGGASHREPRGSFIRSIS